MRISKLAAIMSVSLVALLVGLGVTTAQADGTQVEWERIVGIIVPLSIVGQHVGSPPCTVNVNCVRGAGFPWTAKEGRAQVDLGDGQVEFKVKGLALSGDPPPAVIGTTGIVRMVKGTLVCNVTDAGTTANLVDTPSVALSAQGDAKFSGTVSLPSACTNEPDDIAFLIRVAAVAAGAPDITDLWIAPGAVRMVDDDDDKDKDKDDD